MLFLLLCGVVGETSEVLLMCMLVIFRKCSVKKLFLKQVIRNRRALKPKRRAALEALVVGRLWFSGGFKDLSQQQPHQTARLGLICLYLLTVIGEV